MGHPAIDTEVARLRAIIQEAKMVDPIDVAIIEALASTEVGDALGAILNDGAIFTSSTLSPAGSMEGIALITFETEWPPGQSHLTLPLRVSVLLEISPPRVLKVEKHPGETGPAAAPFSFPSGPAPVAVRGMTPPKPAEILAFLRESARSTEEWLKNNNLSIGSADPLAGTFKEFNSTGTKCSSLLCAEKSSDEDDYKD